jgi:hypothetical protein
MEQEMKMRTTSAARHDDRCDTGTGSGGVL